ncbi:MAG TPA: inositol monophosphatase [Chloroflexi bacterium]|nr:inositol monophosphatase [Chloroflexota bacterium]
MLQTAIEAAQRAGQVIAARYLDPHHVTVKGYRDIVTEADAAAETVILNLIRERFPQHAILSEEAGGDELDADCLWVVDPIDGTTNYAHRIPIFCVSIAVLQAGQPVLGVIHDPMRDQTFVAERGRGAWRDGAPIHASRVETLAHTVVGVDWGHKDEVRAQILDYVQRVAPHCGTVRALGSAALALAYVAAGWLDAYFHLGLKPWDVAAAMLLIAEAGGRCTTIQGEPFHVNLPGCLATNGLLHQDLLTALGTAKAAD